MIKVGHNPANIPPPSKPEDSIFCKTNKAYKMKVEHNNIISV